MKVNGQWVPCVRNSSYSFILILLKLNRYCDHALKICMWFGYNPQINFYYFFCNLNLGLFQENLPGRHGTEPNFFHRGGRCSDSFSFLGRQGR